MPLYSFKDSALIESVAIRQSLIEGTEATILFKEGADPTAVDNLLQQLGQKNFPTMKDVVDGKAAVQVRGIRDEKDLFAVSDQLNVTSATKEQIPEDSAGEKKSIGNPLKKSSLLLAAIMYDIGNAAFIVSGIQRGRHNPGGKFTKNDIAEMGVGAAFATGDVLMTKYGKNRGSEELAAASEGLRKYLKQKNIIIPEGDTLNPETLYQSGVVKGVDTWLQKHILSVKYAAEATGGLSMITSALKPGARNNQKLAAGALLTSGWTTGLLLEKPRGHKIFNVEPDSNLSFIDRLKRNPRLIASTASIGNNFLNIAGALRERKQWASHPTKKNDYIYNLISCCSFLVGNTIFALSGRGRPDETEADKALTNDMVVMAANTIASNPELGKPAIEDAAEYIATKLDHVTMSKEEVTKALTDKVNELSKSTWASRAKLQPPETPKTVM